MQDNIDIKQNNFVKGLNKDLAPSYITQDLLYHLRNGTLFSHDGEYLSVQTEQSPREITTLPYPIIGHVKLPNGTWAVFLTDNISSEIGVFDEKDYSYTKKLNASWLNFNQSNLITGASSELQNGDISIKFADGRRNPDRNINLSKLSTVTEENTLLSILTKPPFLDLKQSNAGTLPNGNYQAAIRYSINQLGFGSYYSLTLPISIYHDNDNSGALEVSIDNLDNDFDFFELVIIQNRKGTTTAKTIGVYPRATSKVHISSFERPEEFTLELKDLVIQNQPWIASDQIVSNNQLLFRIGVETIPELNYQLQAFDIKSEYVITQYPEDYYEYGDNVGLYRDETYAYWIQWLHVSGAYSSAFTLPGREATPQDLQLASGSDVYEALIKNCEEPDKIPYWKVYNTAEPIITIPTEDDIICDGIEIGHGSLAYYESTDKYPSNTFQFGKWANTSIRHIKTPDEQKAPRFSVKDGKAYINVLGVRFSKISHPKKEDGTPDTNWIGYRIIRADREGNRSVISRMLLTNVRSYNENVGSETKEVFYTNYPVNDLSPDTFISQTQTTYKNGKEQNFNPLTTIYYNKFNAYSPHFDFSRYGLGEELKIETEEIAQVTGHFREVYNHPKNKLLSLFSFWLAAILGAVEALLVTTGKRNFKAKSEFKKTTADGGYVNDFETEYKLQSVEDLIGLNPISLIKDAVTAGSGLSAINVVRQVLTGIAAAGLKVLTFTFWGIQYADQVLDIIWKFLGNVNYALQYNSHAFFNSQTAVKDGNKRRYISHYQYLQSGLQSIEGKLYNNFRKHPSVYIELNQDVSKFKNVDDTRKNITDAGIGNSPLNNFTTKGVAFYATNKRNIPNQYGRVESNINFLLTHNNYFEAIPTDNRTTYTTSTLYGGDCFITKYSIQTKHQFFTQDQSQPLFSKEGEEFDYNLYRNIAFPRFWANFFKYDFSELISRKIINFTKFSRTVVSRHNLDNKGKDDTNSFRVDNAYFYTSSNSVLEYFVESDFNTYFRQPSDNDTFFYSNKFTSIDEIFRSDRLSKTEKFKYDFSLNSKANQIYAQQQPIDYNPSVYNTQFKYSRNRLVYSLPSFQEQKYDNWQYFLTGNSYEFPKSEFGSLTSVLRVDGERLLFLFDRSSPYITVGRNELQLSNLTITIGDGGVFAQPPKELLYTEQHFGNSQSRFGAISTQFGAFYPSERQGRLMKFSQNLDEVTRNGLHTWSKEYFPIKLTEFFPDFTDIDNPAFGVGYFSSFDAQIDMLYISKKDYMPIPEKSKFITYDKLNNQFYYKTLPILLTNPDYFTNLSFTLSYSPTLNAFISFHDWYPDWTIPTEKHFITSKGNKLYIHNDNPLSYCNYYGITYPFEIGYYVNNKLQVETLSNIEYYLECYKYKPDGINKVHLLNENFSHAIITNSEQISGLLTLHTPTNNPYEDILYPKSNFQGYDIISEKSENKQRLNDFWDICKDRNSNKNLINFLPDGYKFKINPDSIDVNKSPFERKLFRHNQILCFLIKDQPISKMILRLSLSKELPSPI